jgi:transaldolase
MPATADLHDLGQSLWLDNITRTMLDDGTIQRYIDQCSVSGLTSNPSIFDNAIRTGAYDEAIAALAGAGSSGEALFFELAIEDLRRAADLFLGEHERTAGVDGWVSLEVSPKLAYDPDATVAAATALHARAGRPNLFIKIPGTAEGLPAVESAIAAGVPVNVTLLFSSAHYLAAAEAYMRGIERRLEDGLDPVVGSVASIFMSRWDVAANDQLPDELRNQLGLAVGADAFRSYRQLLDSPRWQRLEGEGARPQRLLFASTSAKDPKAPDTLYVSGLAAPNTVNTMPDKTIDAFHDHGELDGSLPADGGDCDHVLASVAAAGVDVAALAAKLQRDGAGAFVSSWNDLIDHIETQSKAVA